MQGEEGGVGVDDDGGEVARGGAEVADQQQRHQRQPRHGRRHAEVAASHGGPGPLEQGGRRAARAVQDGVEEHDAQGNQVLEMWV